MPSLLFGGVSRRQHLMDDSSNDLQDTVEEFTYSQEEEDDSEGIDGDTTTVIDDEDEENSTLSAMYVRNNYHNDYNRATSTSRRRHAPHPSSHMSHINTSTTSSSSSIVQINVGGIHYDVSGKILKQLPLLFQNSNDWSPTFDNEGRVFLDRDGTVFADIIDFVRNGPSPTLDLILLSHNRQERLARLASEAQFYGLDDLPALIRAYQRQHERRQHIGKEIQFVKWSRVEGHIAPESNPSFWNWTWTRRSGDLSVFRSITTSPNAASINANTPSQSTPFHFHQCYHRFEIKQPGLYLLLLRLYTPCHEHLGKAVYTSDWDDEFVRVCVGHSNMVQFPLVDSCRKIPIARSGAFDYRLDLSDEQRTHYPEYKTVTSMEFVELEQGDFLVCEYPSIRTLPSNPIANIAMSASSSSSTSAPLRNRPPRVGVAEDTPSHLLHSLTLLQLQGDSLARYQRLSQTLSTPIHEKVKHATWKQRFTDRPGGLGSKLMATAATTTPLEDANEKKNNGSPNRIQVPVDGLYLVFGQVAVTATTKVIDPLPSSKLKYGHAAHLLVRSPNQRITYAQPLTCLELCTYTGHVDRVCEFCPFADVIPMKQHSSLEVVADGDVTFHKRGTADDRYCQLPCQNLNILLLPTANPTSTTTTTITTTRVERFVSVFDREQNEVVGWERSPLSWNTDSFDEDQPQEQQLAVVDDTAGIRVVGGPDDATAITVLVLVSIPPRVAAPSHHHHNDTRPNSDDRKTIALVRNGEAEALSVTVSHCGQWHHIRELIQVKNGDILRVMEVHRHQETWRRRLLRPLSEFPFAYRGHITILELG